MENNIPNLFIIGLAKAGTTALADLLSQHPDVFFSEVKEPNFFSYQYLDENEIYYNESSIQDKTGYLNLFNARKEQYLGEASVSYFNYPKSTFEIKRFNPEAKAILILRNPVERAISHYLMDKRLGYVDQSLESIINDPERYPMHYFQYINQSFYFDRLVKVKEAFGDDLLVLPWMPNLVEKGKEVLSFLDLPMHDFSDEKRNQSLEPNNSLMRALYKNSKMRKSIASVTSTLGVNYLIKRNLFRKQSVQINSAANEHLNSLFQKDCEMVESLISLKLL